jgi:hypothetical protein
VSKLLWPKLLNYRKHRRHGTLGSGFIQMSTVPYCDISIPLEARAIVRLRNAWYLDMPNNVTILGYCIATLNAHFALLKALQS